jgi:hypothetical protein
MRHKYIARKGIGMGHRATAFSGFIGALVEIVKRIAGKKISARLPQYLINLKRRF